MTYEFCFLRAKFGFFKGTSEQVEKFEFKRFVTARKFESTVPA